MSRSTPSPFGQANPWLAGTAPRGADYDRRFEELAASGENVHGEADLVESLRVRRVLDAGCGTGRVAIELARRGLQVTGVDLDDRMLSQARAKAPDLEWMLADLATLTLSRAFDAVVLAGNVMLFLDPGTGPAVLERAAAHLSWDGVLVAGFSLGSALSLADYDGWAGAAGFVLSDRFATWSRERFHGNATYAVSVHRLLGPGTPAGTRP